MDLLSRESAVRSSAAASTQPALPATAEQSPNPLTASLPDKPLVAKEAGKHWSGLDLRALWAHRELLYFLTWRDIKVRYKQTFIGAAWAVVQPLFVMIVFSLFFGKFNGIPSDGMPYPLFAYTGLLPWTFFANAVTSSSNSLIGNTHLLTKVYFPRMIIPISAVVAGLVDLAVASALLVVLTLYYGVAITWSVLALPLFVVLAMLLALGLGMWVSALSVKYRDIRYALPYLVQMWMFASPVIYPSSVVPDEWRWAMWLNPMSGIIEGFRAALVGRAFDTAGIAVSILLTIVLLVCSAYAFRRIERTFADLL